MRTHTYAHVLLSIFKLIIFHFLVSKNMSGQNLTASGNYTIRKKKNESNTTLLTPAYFSRHYLRVSDSSGERQEEYYLPKMIEPCKKCENVRCIKEHTVVQTSCYCSEIIPANYLTYTPSTDDIYKKMSAPQSDLPWS